MEAIAKLRNCSMSARKMRMVADLVRGKEIDEALNILKFNKREGKVWIEKVLLSAISNWENNNDDGESADDYGLFIKTLLVDEGTMLKRYRPAPHGRAHRIRKRTCHVTIVLDNKIALPSEGVEDEIEVEEIEAFDE